MLPVGSMQGMFGILHAWFPALKVVLIGAVIALICIDHMDWMPQPPSHWFPLVPIGYMVTCFECKFIQLWITIPNHCILYSYQYHSYLEDIAPLRFGSGQKKTLCVSGKISDGWSETSESGVDLNGRASLGLWIQESSVLAMSLVKINRSIFGYWTVTHHDFWDENISAASWAATRWWPL